MSTTVYYIWFILPGILIVFGANAFIRPYISKRACREDVGAYFEQAGFTLICFVVAIFLDWYLVADLIKHYLPDSVTFILARFFIYPVVLLLAVQIQRIVKKENKEMGKNEYKPRVRY